MKFTNDFAENVSLISAAFERDGTFTAVTPRKGVAVLLLNCMVNTDVVDRDVIAPLAKQRDGDRPLVFAHSVTPSSAVESATCAIASGDLAVVCADPPCVFTVDVKGMPQRGVDAPQSEQNSVGPAEGFNENVMSNLALLRRRLPTPRLKCERVVLGGKSPSSVFVCYLDGVVRPSLVSRLRRRLQAVNADYIPDINFLAETVSDGGAVPECGKTERPDVLAAKLTEGRVGVLLGGSPTAMTLPFLFIESFQTPDDYYLSWMYANVGRALRIGGFYLSIFLPALYIAIILHHRAVLPPEWLYSISTSQTGVPTPSVLEMILLFGVFEILRETGARMTGGVGLALNVVGAIILGQAAVDAKLVCAPTVIVVSFSGVTGLMVSRLKGTIIFARAAALLAGAFAGIPGVIAVACAFYIELCSRTSLGVPVMHASSPVSRSGRRDTFFRAPSRKLEKSAVLFGGEK